MEVKNGIPAPRVALAGQEIGPDTRPLTMNNAPAGAEAMMNEGGIINGNQMDAAGAERMGDNGTGIQSEGDAGSKLIAENIQKELVGKKIITEDGDIIRVTGRAPGEVAYGTNSAELYEAAKKSGDYAGISAKQKAATKAAAIISVSKFERWGDNVKESKTNDQFSADGFNYRKAQVIIDGVPYSATVVTALNYNEKSKDYGEKFYDITDVYEIESPELSAKLRDGENAMSPYKIQIKADHSGDVLSVAQKQRAVKGENVGYVSGDTAGKTPTQIAPEKAVEAAGGKITWSRGGENLLTKERTGMLKVRKQNEK